jgi:ATP phosphoribosyltransferase
VITIVRPKDRIFDVTLPLLLRAGSTVTEDPETSRKPILGTSHRNVRVIIVRATDVSTHGQYGAAALKLKRKSSQPLLDTFAAAAP